MTNQLLTLRDFVLPPAREPSWIPSAPPLILDVVLVMPDRVALEAAGARYIYWIRVPLPYAFFLCRYWRKSYSAGVGERLNQPSLVTIWRME